MILILDLLAHLTEVTDHVAVEFALQDFIAGGQ